MKKNNESCGIKEHDRKKSANQDLEELSSSTTTDQNPPDNISELKLLAPSNAAKLLGLRVETLMSLIKEGKIKVLRINTRVKIPYFELRRFIVDNLESVTVKKNNGRVNIWNSKNQYTSNTFETKEIVNKIIGDKNGNSN